MLFVLVVFVFASFIDPDTPKDVYKTTSSNVGNEEGYELVFSDEFEVEGRTFVATDDPHWTAVNTYNPTTGDLEVYLPEYAVTENGSLSIKTELKISLDHSGTPFGFSTAMVQSWNQMCYTGGILEARLRLPGNNKVGGLWPAFWLAGNLARVGVTPADGSVFSNDGIWPLSYEECDNLAQELQKYSACDDPSAFCKYKNLTDSECEIVTVNRKLLGNKARGQPEIDLLEASTSTNGSSGISTSLQISPFTDSNEWVNGAGECYEKVLKGLSTGDETEVNSYRGDVDLRDAISAATGLIAEDFTDFTTYRLEWEPDNYIGWYRKRGGDADFVKLFEISQSALEACGKTGKRPIPKEPMYILINTALSNSFSAVDVSNPDFMKGFPHSFDVDYVRVYQNPARISTDCSPEEYPSKDFIRSNLGSFFLEAPTGDYLTCPCDETISQDQTYYTYLDERCPVLNRKSVGGCTSQSKDDKKRRCVLKSDFETNAFTDFGLYGKSPGQPTQNWPICPPIVCQDQKIDQSECTELAIPGTTGCISIDTEKGTIQYCGNSLEG